MIIVASLGFEEKFILRAIMRRGLKEGDKIVVIMPEGGDTRGERALQVISDVVLKLSDGTVEVVKHQVNVRDFYGAVSSIRNLLRELSLEGRLVVNLSGGIRLLIIETLAAVLSLGLQDAEIEIETEDSSTVAVIPVRALYPLELELVEKQILQQAAEKGEIRLKDLEGLKLPKATLWRKLARLTQQGLLEKTNDKYRVSDLGRMRV
ncbi:MAG: CRISPR locus-related DNA-binding protein [Candidatus Freyarchaeota archaeon]|nr:CRISPR locus-related DNA-binding protein [Candidatus Jordarchaeia archaeon]